MCFEGFVSPRIASESNFDLESHLVLNSLAVDDSVQSSELNLLLRCLSTQSAVCIFSVVESSEQNLLYQHVLNPSIEPSIDSIQSWPSVYRRHQL